MTPATCVVVKQRTMFSDSEDINAVIKKISKHSDQEAFRSFFDRFYPRLIKLAYYFLESGLAADEIVSNVFINIWNNRKTLSEINRIEAYLFNAVKFNCLNHLRDSRRIHLQTIENEEFKIIPSFEDPEGVYLHGELRNKIFDAINNLPPRCRIIFELVRDNGLKYKEVAGLLDISVKTVEVQMGRALTKIRHEIKPYLDEHELQSTPHRENKVAGLLSIFL